VELLLVALVVVAAVAAVVAPLRPGWEGARQAALTAERAELEAARDAKYAEIREAELDHRTGKLSAADWRAIDRTLRGEAVEILHRLDALA
jgi:type II secretory pathway pseudopilin PulG